MPLAYPAKLAVKTTIAHVSPFGMIDFRAVVVDDIPYLTSVFQDTSVGNPDPPSQRQERRGTLKFIAPVRPGSQAFKIDVMYTPDEDPRPRMIIRADPILGITQHLIGDAPAGTGWVTIAINVVASTAGAVEVWRELRHTSQLAVAWWDNFRIE